MTLTLAERFEREVASLVGTPWMSGGRVTGVGLDCLGVTLVAALAVGISLPDPNRERVWTRDCWREWSKHFRRVRSGPAQTGDLLLYLFDGAGHLGVQASDGRVWNSSHFMGLRKIRMDRYAQMPHGHWRLRKAGKKTA